MDVTNQTVDCHYDSTTGKIHGGRMMGVGFNLGKHTSSNNAFPFCNALKSSSFTIEVASTPTFSNMTARGYCTITGGSYDFAIASQWMHTGDWTLRWSGTCDAQLTDLPAGWSGGTKTGTVNAWERVYTVTQNATNGTVRVRFTGGTLTNTIEAALICPGEVARYEAGNIIHSQWLSDLAGMTVARTMDWQQVNYSPISEHSDYSHYDDISWNSRWFDDLTPTNDLLTGVPIRAMCEAMMEFDVDWWFCSPHQASEACTTATFAEIESTMSAAWKSAHKIYHEVSNEATFNFEQEKWYQCAGSPLLTPTYDTVLDLFTFVSHGLQHGDKIACFSNMSHYEDGLVDGASRFIYKHSDDTFSISKGGVAPALGDLGNQAEILVISTATQTNPVEITVEQNLPISIDTGDKINIRGITTGMTGLEGLTRQTITKTASNKFTIPFDATLESPATSDHGYIHLHSEFNSAASTGTRIKKNTSQDASIQLANAEVIHWPLAKTAAPNITILNVHGAHQNAGAWPVEQAAQFSTGWLEQLDYVSWAPYFDFKLYVTPTYSFNWWQDLDAATTTWLSQNNNQPSSEHNRMANAVGRYNLLGYEGGDHNGPQSSPSAQHTAMMAFARSANATTVHLQYFKNIRQRNFQLLCYYHSHGDYAGSAPWGAMEYPGQTTAPEYLGIKPYLDAGGAPTL